ncbi:MAG: hypothetical protein H6739_31090 [Alphaproteobacteria bacterium]|nr:hypothetical protein [Alphaproteobacteria bacterium]
MTRLLPLTLLLGCAEPIPTDPETLGLTVCRALPGLWLDGAGQAYARNALDPEELALYAQDRSYGRAIAEIGLDGWGVIRANSLCAVDRVEGDAVHLTREEPDLTALKPFNRKKVYKQERVTRSLTVQLVDTAVGPRAQVGLVDARGAANAAWDRAEAGDYGAAIQGFEDLQARFPDPLIAWELQALRRLSDQAARQAALALSVEDELLWVRAPVDAGVSSGVVNLDCGEAPFERTTPPLGPDETVALMLPETVLDPTLCAFTLPFDWQALPAGQ